MMFERTYSNVETVVIRSGCCNRKRALKYTEGSLKSYKTEKASRKVSKPGPLTTHLFNRNKREIFFNKVIDHVQNQFPGGFRKKFTFSFNL